jgi:hypothetical protein
MFSFSSIARDYISLQAPCQIFVDRSGRFESSIPRSLASDIQIHFLSLTSHIALSLLIFITFCVLNRIMSYDQSKSTDLIVQNFEKVEMSISRFLRRKSKLCSLEIICNTMLFIFEIEIVLFSSISRDYISLQAPCQIFVDRPPDLNHRFLVPLHLMFRFKFYIWCVMLHCCYWYSSLLAFLTVSWIMTSPSMWLKSMHLIVDGLFVASQHFIQLWSSFHFMF